MRVVNGTVKSKFSTVPLVTVSSAKWPNRWTRRESGTRLPTEEANQT